MAASVNAEHAHLVNLGFVVLEWWLGVEEGSLPFVGLKLSNMLIGHPHQINSRWKRGSIRLTHGIPESLPTHQEAIRLLARGSGVLVKRY